MVSLGVPRLAHFCTGHDGDAIDVKNKFFAAEALRGVGGLVFNALGNRFASELGRLLWYCSRRALLAQTGVGGASHRLDRSSRDDGARDIFIASSDAAGVSWTRASTRLVLHGRAARRYGQVGKAVVEGLRVGAAAAERLHSVCGDCSLRRPQLGMALERTAVRLARVWRPRQALHSVRSLGRCSGRRAESAGST